MAQHDISSIQQRLRWLANSAIGLAIVVILLGGWTRLNDAGLGCPDWPGCYGEWILPSDAAELQQAQARYPQRTLELDKGWLEMLHRYAAGSLGMLIIVINVLGWRARRWLPLPLALMSALSILVIAQGIFGMWTVTLKLLPQIVTLHLLGGLLTLTLLVMLRQQLSVSVPGKSAGDGALRIAIVLLFVQLMLGGWTSTNYAGWACTDWLQCHAQQDVALDFRTGFDIRLDIGPDYEGGVKPLDARAAIQVTHRWMALLLVAWLLWSLWRLRAQPRLQRPIQSVYAVLLLQLMSGVANVIWGVPLLLAMLHHTGAVALLLSLLWLYQQSRYCSREVSHASSNAVIHS